MKNISLLNDLTEYIEKYPGKDKEVSNELTKNLEKNVFTYGSTPYDTAKKLITSINKESGSRLFWHPIIIKTLIFLFLNDIVFF